MEKLREEFAEAVRESIKKCHDMGFEPVRLEKMLREQHPVEGAIQLIVSGEFQDGFKFIISQGMEDITVESLMLQPRFAGLFSSDQLDVAAWRLRTVGGQLSGGDAQ